MNSIKPARGRMIFWRAINLMLVACMLFGLGALGTAAGGRGASPSDDATSTAPDDSGEATEEPPAQSLERTEAPKTEDAAVTRLAATPEGEAGVAEDGDQSEVLPVAPDRPRIKRNMASGPKTIGDKWNVKIVVTVPAGRRLLEPQIIDLFSKKGVYYVDGSSEITQISTGTPTQPAVLRTAVDQPIITENSDGARFAFNFKPIEAGADQDYVFQLQYKVKYTGVKPSNGKQEMWLPGDSQGVKGFSRLWWYHAGSSSYRSETTDTDKTKIDQPLLALKKIAGGNFTSTFYPGWYVYFNTNITNQGYSTAYDITWKDKLPDEMSDPMLLGVFKSSDSKISGAVDEQDITDQVTADFTSDKPKIDFNDVSLDPDGEEILVAYVAWVDWFSMPDGIASVLAPSMEIKNRADVNWTSKEGKVKGERVYDDQDWEHKDGQSWKKDTDRATIDISRTGPSLAIYKDVSEDTLPVVVVGDEIEYDITVMNSSATTASIVPISDRWYADELEFISASITPDDVDQIDGIATWDDLSDGAGLAPGASIDFTTTFKAVGGGNDVQNRAFIEWGRYYADVSGPEGIDASSIMEFVDVLGPSHTIFEGNLAIAEIDIVDPADTTFVKSADPVEGTIMLPGEKITYTITGQSNTTSFNALITDTLDSSVEFVPGSIRVKSGSYEMDITDDITDGPGGYDPDSRTVIFYWPWVPEATPGELIFDVVVRDEEFSKQGVQNTAVAWAVPMEGEDLTEEFSATSADFPMPEGTDLVYIRDSNTVYHPVDPFVIEKTAEDVNGGQLLPGDDILWTITVTNTGITPTTNVVVYDTVPEHTTYKAGSITGLGADDSGNPDLVWNVGQMPVDGVEVCTFISTVDIGTPNGTQITNQAAVESDQSFLAFSDSPTTSETGDATLLQTGQNDWLWLTLALLAAGLGTAFTLGGRKWLKSAA